MLLFQTFLFYVPYLISELLIQNKAPCYNINMRNTVTVSIVVPVYNVERYLDDCIKSILAQKHKTLEVILVDDGSTDNSGTMCDQYAKKFDFIHVIHKSNEGVNYARRDGFFKSQGEFIAFVDSDDIIALDFISTHLDLLNKTNSDISVGKTHSFYGESLTKSEVDQCQVKGEHLDYSVWTDKKVILSAFMTTLPPYGNMALMCLWSKLYRREILENVNWEIANYTHGEDYFINVQAYDNAISVCYINEYCYYYRRNRTEKLTLNAQYNKTPNGEKINNLAYVKELKSVYEQITKKRNLDLSKEIVITQCRLYTYWLDKLIDMNLLSSDLWDKYIKNELIPLIPKFKSKSFSNYMRENLTYGEKRHKDLCTKLDPIYENQEIEKFFQNKISIIKESLKKPQISNDYTNAWVVMDRPYSATDSGYHFYKWMKEHNPNVNIFYVIDTDSKDVPILESEGFNLVFTGTEQHINLLNKCIVEVYAYYTFNLCPQRTEFNSIKVYLGHGIKLNNSLNPGLSKNDLFVTTFKREFEFFKKNHQDFTTIQTGLPRFENLLKTSNEQKNHIVIAPQWRRWLNKKANKEDNYFVQWTNFLQSKELKDLSSKHKITFMIHPELEAKSDFLYIPKYIETLRYQDLGAMRLQKLINQTKLLITDFSSIAVDYTIAGADIIYFQFDRDEYYDNHTAKKGWYDYDNDGFGPVFFNINDLKKYIASYPETSESDRNIYKNRLDSLLNNDNHVLETPSENVYENIVEHLKNKES
jgi:glycosyltransferase involved in cell wall biosynthesis